MRNYYEISADLVTSSDVRHVTRVLLSSEALSIAGHVTRVTLLKMCTKCEGKFVPDDRTIHVITAHAQ